jgi:hypothetical protein
MATLVEAATTQRICRSCRSHISTRKGRLVGMSCRFGFASSRDVGDFGSNRVDGCERPAGEIRHRFGGVNVFGAGRLIDRERVAAEGFAFLADVRDLSFECAAAVAKNDGAVRLEAYKLVRRSVVFLLEP